MTINLEKLVNEVEQIKQKHGPREGSLDGVEPIYLYAYKDPTKNRKFLDKANEYCENCLDAYKPRNLKEKVWAAVNPGSYMLWKMPFDFHKKVNDFLAYATPIATRSNPLAGAITGLTYAVYQLVYGLKKRSFKDTVYGAVSAVTHIKKLPLSAKGKRSAQELMDSLHQHFSPKPA